ncbi:MAG: hypothetical protein IKE56_05280 [Lachnospiraceae bacterium]|nr:hypothetical protein [Lachnospiraceae bacterium]
MKITLIRTARPNHEAPLRCSSAAFNETAAADEHSGILPYTGRIFETSGRIIYCGTQERYRQTAKALFGIDTDPHHASDGILFTPFLDEIPMRAFIETERELPLSVWKTMALLQWLAGDPRQPETRSRSIQMAVQFIDELLQKHANCILISDERRINLLVRELRNRRFRIKRGGFRRIDYLDRIVATDNEPHCGGCMHDCPLTNPGCMIGKDKAAKAGLTRR